MLARLGERCAVCGYRRWTHWWFREPFYAHSFFKWPQASRGWFW